jgi:hypothetical protein
MLPAIFPASRMLLAVPCLCAALAAQTIAARAAELPRVSPAAEISTSRPLSAEAANAGSPASRLSGPTLGFLFDARGGALLRIPGIAGAASLGARLELGFRLSQAVVGPQQDFVMAARAGDRQAVLIRFLAGAVEVSSPGAASAVDHIALSPAGLSAALYDAAQTELTIVTGLPLSPSIVRRLDISAATGELTALAIADDPDYVLVASAAGEAGSVFAVPPEGSLAPVYTGGRVAAIRFLDGRQDAAFADASLGRVYLARGLPAAVTLELLAGEQDGIASPVAIEASRDSRRLFVANSDSGVITTIDLAARQAAQFSCQCRPTRLSRLTGEAVFQLTDPSSQPLKIFDGGARGPRVLAIPGTAALANDEPRLPPRARSRSPEARP